MTDRKVVNTQNVTLLPTTVYHVPVNGVSDLIHFRKGNGCAVAKGCIQGHFVAKQTILDESKKRHQNEMNDQVYVFHALETVPQLHGECCPVKDLFGDGMNVDA